MANDDQVDLLQIKIENAKAKLPAETANAIAAVDWKAAILALRQKKGYSFEQLADLELETELILCGLTSPEEYPKELQTRMRLSKADTDELINEMNTQVFSKIKEEMIKNSERKKVFEKKVEVKSETPAPVPTPAPVSMPPTSPVIDKTDTTVLKSAGIEFIKPTETTPVEKPVVENREEMLKKVENPEPTKIVGMHPAMQEKIFGSVQTPIVKTEHTDTATPATAVAPAPTPASTAPKIDPYREIPE